LALIVFESEIAMAGGEKTEIGDFSENPDVIELRFESPLNNVVKFADGEELPARLTE
jgi:hypothetical protein